MKALLAAKSGMNFEHQGDVMRALASGMARHGIETRLRSTPAYPRTDDDFFVSWGDKIQTQASDVPHLILECGYINGDGDNYTENRMRFISTSWNRRHGLSDWIWPDEVNSDRWSALGIELQAWRQVGKYVLLLEQHPADRGAPDVEAFRRDIVAECERREWPCRVRYHPSNHGNEQTLDEDLADASLAITWCSTASVEAVIAGVPTYVLGPGSIAAPVTRHLLEHGPFIGDRSQWVNRLAYRQWTMSELADGSAWPHIQSGLQ